jgi:leucyl aminopeptidase
VNSMKITASPLPEGIPPGSGTLALFVFSGEPLPEGILPSADVAPASALLDDPSFKAKKGKIVKALLPDSVVSPLYLVGLGERKDFSEDSLRSRTAELVRRAKGDGVSRIAAVLPVPPCRNTSCAVAEGAELGIYTFDKYKTVTEEDRLPEPGEFVLYGGDDEGLSLGKMLACAQNTARSLANEPGNKSNPTTLAEYALAEAADFGLEADVWDERKLLEERMEGIYSVGMASSTPPRLVRLSWKPKCVPLRKVVFVGKGITFDSGGLNLKPGEYIRTMKGDKSGACNVFAILRAAAKMKLPLEVHGIVALAENMPGGKAFRPDDILRMRNGKTVEIDNTDAEGRLVLADALSYASELGPDVIIDMATLTGACAVALGSSIAGLFTSDDSLAASLIQAGKARGERLWRLPDDDERIAESLKSPVADLVNSGNRYGGAIFAARFLREFVGNGISWAHLDIAGVDFNKEEYSVYGKGASGFGVRTCLQYLLSIR